MGTAIDLPRLAVIADVRVERTQGGQLLLHRLLSSYPPEKLFVLETTLRPSPGDEYRLPAVQYHEFKHSLQRIYASRANPIGPWMHIQSMRRFRSRVRKVLDPFQPQAVLTVTHDYFWINAAQYAREKKIPLHLILHDDFETTVCGNRTATRPFAMKCVRPTMRRVYRQAASRFCVSPGMNEYYERLYGAQGTVMYPNRGDDSPEPRVRCSSRLDPSKPTIAFAGALHTQGVRQLCQAMKTIMQGLGGHLDLYTATPKRDLEMLGLVPPVVRTPGFLPPQLLAEKIANASHALFLPASFLPGERVDTSTLFPSKLADYTAIGLPVIIWGPPESSAARWGAENPLAAITITQVDYAQVQDSILKIVKDPQLAARLAENAIQAGVRDFDAKTARGILLAALKNAFRSGTPT